MKLSKAIDIGTECGCGTIDECVAYIEAHAISLFPLKKMHEEIEELRAEYEDMQQMIMKYGQMEAKKEGSL